MNEMNGEEIRQRLLRVAERYRNEVGRNRQFEEALSKARLDISEAAKYRHEMDEETEKHEQTLKQLQHVQSKVEQSGLYDRTLQKQHQVLAKYERLLDNVLGSAIKQQAVTDEIARTKDESEALRRQIREAAFSRVGGSTIGNAQKEVSGLQALADDLRDQIAEKKAEHPRGHGERRAIELEILLKKAKMRAEAMQDEMDTNTMKYAREIARYKAILVEKRAF
jgi:hypothetical protein